MSTRILRVRHGETRLTLEDRFAGPNDEPLSDEEREQAASLGMRLSSVPIAAAYASSMARTMETAQRVAAPHGLPVQTDVALRDMTERTSKWWRPTMKR